MDELKYHTLPNLGYITGRFSDEQLSPIKLEIDKIISNGGQDWNKHLAGHINKEYKLLESFDHLSKLMLPLSLEYENIFNFIATQNNVSANTTLKLQHAWVNLQTAGEYNPIHNHSGLLSFVIWINIPYDYEQEHKRFDKMNKAQNHAADFSFHYNNSIGQICSMSLGVDKSFENTFALFPAELNHSVNPFYGSDGYRISVSGNIGEL